MRWLHLSDLHIGKDNSSQKSALPALVSAVTRFANGRTFDFVIITGDLANSGRADEYDSLEKLVIRPLQNETILRDAKLIAVPGNHDLDCDFGLPIAWESLGPSRKLEILADSDVGRKLRSQRSEGFTEFEKFVVKTSGFACLPTQHVGALLDLPRAGKNGVAVICLNTANFSDKEVKDDGLAPAPVNVLRSLLDSVGGRTPFVIGHHPIRWFLKETGQHMKTLLIEKNAVYLHGHLHEIESQFGPKGLVSLGFGAAYQGPPSAPAKPYYRNSFAICELSDALNVEFYSWDSDYGGWVEETRLPGEIQAVRSADGRSYTLDLPTAKAESMKAREASRQRVSTASVKARITPPIWIDCDLKTGWVKLLEQLGHLRGVTKVTAVGPQDPQGGAVQFVAVDSNGGHLISAFSAASYTITYSLIEQTNTLLDTESVDSCILATFGSLSEEAETLSARLKNKKALRVLTGLGIASEASTLPVVIAVRESGLFEMESVSITPLIVQDGIALLVFDAAASEWFCVIGPEGEIIAESADLIFRVRRALPELRETPYWAPTTRLHRSAYTPEPDFDRRAYLDRAASLFDTVRYAGLAALGFRMPVDSLRKLYVPAAADVATDRASQEALKTAVDDFIEALKLDNAQRDQLEMQLRNYYGIGRTAEAGAASGLYQKYGAVLVTGDPGSGKSCFVRNEILAYTQPPHIEGDWYGKHTPVFLPLADAARMAERGDEILDICVNFSATQRLALTRAQLDLLISRGQIAFFFDGVDEVGSLDLRQKLLKEISSLMENYRHLGNRFVVTSRSAAIHSADVPDELTRIHLRGLTNAEISLLATRIMSIDATTGEMANEPREEARYVVEQLLRDCDDKPGIRRLARNPLLLTLLVLVYANGGALAARRHNIYSQAIKTLVSVRQRTGTGRVLSEADLRRRLGRLALAIYRGIVSEIPTRQEVREALHEIHTVVAAEEETEDIDHFVHDVAEKTGLVVIHPRSDTTDGDVFSFMHHSFLEYYAAVGFMSEDGYREKAPLVALRPRWREVITLMFGLLGEQGDISGFLAQVARERDGCDTATASRLEMTLECALECDVPPEEAQKLIGELLGATLNDGAGRVVADVREALAGKTQELMENTGSEIIRDRLLGGLWSGDDLVAAAHLDFLVRMPRILNGDAAIRTAVTELLKKGKAAIRVAAVGALEVAPKLRTEENLVVVQECLTRGSISDQMAALQFLDSQPALISQFSDSVLDALNSKSHLVSGLAARCVLIGGIFARGSYEHRGLLDKALRIYMQADGPQKRLDAFIDLETERLEELIASQSPEDQKFGIRCLLVMRREPAALHEYLFSVLRGATHHEVRSACLDAMAVDARMIRVASLADTELVCKCASDDHLDVRKSAARALRHFPTIGFVGETLRQRYETLRIQGNESEKAEIIKTLAAHGVHDKNIRNFLHEELAGVLSRRIEGWGERRRGLSSRLLNACDTLGGTMLAKGVSLLFEISTDYKTPPELRRLAIRVFGKTCSPTPENGDRIIAFLELQDRRDRLAAYKTVGAFTGKCKGDVSTVRVVHGCLERIKGILMSKWSAEFSGAHDRIDFSGLRDIRAALLALEEVLGSYEEFSSRIKIVDLEKQGNLNLDHDAI